MFVFHLHCFIWVRLIVKSWLNKPNPRMKACARNGGVISDLAQKFDKQINSVMKGCYFQLRNTAKLKFILSQWYENCYHCINLLKARLLQLTIPGCWPVLFVSPAAGAQCKKKRQHYTSTRIPELAACQIDFKVLLFGFKAKFCTFQNFSAPTQALGLLRSSEQDCGSANALE